MAVVIAYELGVSRTLYFGVPMHAMYPLCSALAHTATELLNFSSLEYGCL